MATRNSSFCRFVEWLHRHCAGVHVYPELPLELREASHILQNEVMRLQGQVFKVRQSADELSDLVERTQGDGI